MTDDPGVKDMLKFNLAKGHDAPTAVAGRDRGAPGGRP